MNSRAGDTMQLRLLAALTMTFMFSACAPPQPAATASRDPARITQEEVANSLEANAYDVIAKLRPNFFASRGSTSMRADESSLPAVFVDRIEHGPISSLKLIPASIISEIRMYRSWEAATTFGTGYMSGVIAVTTKR